MAVQLIALVCQNSFSFLKEKDVGFHPIKQNLTLINTAPSTACLYYNCHWVLISQNNFTLTVEIL